MKRVAFSDIDGTLVHYAKPGETFPDVELVTLPVSSSGKTGLLSGGTLTRVQRLRAAGITFVIISGARTKTVLERMQGLPQADAVVSENGGRIFYPDATAPPFQCSGQEFPFVEDLEWRDTHTAAGPHTQDGQPPAERQGALWDLYRRLVEDGWKPDITSYTTCLRVPIVEGKSEGDLKKITDQLPPGLQCTWNLGVVDVYPSTSGKSAAALHLMAKYGSDRQHSVFLCDDDNDLELAANVAKAFLPSVSHVNVEKALQEHPERFVRATAHGPKATEEMLDAVSAYFGLDDAETPAAVAAQPALALA